MKIKALILLFSIEFFCSAVFAQAVYMHEAAEDSDGGFFAGILGMILLFGGIWLLGNLSEAKKQAKEAKEKRKREEKREIERRNEKRENEIFNTKLSQLYFSWLRDNYIGVDLGLSVNWAPVNLGALKPNETGFYYSWGEIEEFRFTDGLQLPFDDCLNIGGDAKYDAATKNIGNGWRLPTNKEVEELITKCKWEKATQNNIKGHLVISSNGNTIFLPCAGARLKHQYDPCGINRNGEYWTSEAHKDDFNGLRACYFGFAEDWEEPHLSHAYRHPGFSIRPVYDKK